MRCNSTILFLLAAALLLGKSERGPEPRVEVHSSNSSLEVIGYDGDQVTANDSSRATVTYVDGQVSVQAPDNSGHLVVQVPRRSAVEAMTSNGAIRVTGVTGALQLTTSNAAITVQSKSAAEIHAHTSNGRIEIHVPPTSNANVSARTSNGQIYSDLEMVTRQLSENQLEGRLGSGGAPIDLQTSNASIYLGTGSDRESVSSTFKPGAVK